MAFKARVRIVGCCLLTLSGSLCALPLPPANAAPSASRSDEAGNSGPIAQAPESLSAPLGAELLTHTPSAETAPEAESDGSSERPTRSGAGHGALPGDESASGYVGLDRTEAAALAKEAFPSLVAQEAGVPALPVGASIVGYLSPTIAAVALPEHQHGVIESTQPMAVETSPNHDVPLDLSLTSTGSVYESTRPSMGVLIAKQLDEGAQLPERGVSLTPVDDQGTPLDGPEGRVDGASVLYPNVQPDTDFAIRPTPAGVEVNTILRSENSPRTLRLRVAVPPSATLSQAGDGGEARVMQDGHAIAVIRPPSARDVEGTPVPVTMSAVGNLLTINVSIGSTADYRWPIAVDPELVSVTDSTINEHSNWLVVNDPTHFKYAWWTGTLEQYNYGGTIPAGASTYAQYVTQGESKVYKVEVETAGTVHKGRAKLAIANPYEVENQTTIAENTSWGATKTTLCAYTGCGPTGAKVPGNLASFKLEANDTITETYSLDASLWNTHVYVAQEKPPAISFDETHATLSDGRANALYGCHCTGGSEPWLGPYSSTAFEAKAHDPGIGVSWAQVWVEGSFHQEFPIFSEGRCKGVQCEEDFHGLWTYNPAMPDGEDTVELDARDLAGNWLLNGTEIGLLGRGTQLLKVDATKPRNLQVSGWPASREISAAPHTLTIEATDGKSPGHSSGVKSIAVAIDGGPQSQVPVTPCTLGQCTVAGKWTLHAEGLAEGVHRLIETATDNASNVASEEFTFDVRHGNPVSVGPGSVDPTSGELKLSSVDASLAGVGAVTRVYQSRNLSAGVGGPLGSQWTLGLAGGQGLTVLPDGSVVLSGSKGAHTTFLRTENEGKVEFEAPLGDSNLKLEAKPQEVGKEITEYALVNTTTGATTNFAQPPGTQNTAPLYTNQFGAEATQLNHPLSDAIDSSGNVWVTDFNNNRIEKFSPTGGLLAAYGSEGEAGGQFHNPWGITINQSTGHVYVTDQSNFRIEELTATGSFVKAIGWGVSDGKAELQVCTSGCRAGISGSGNGQFSWLAGLSLDSSGNLWVADYGNNRVQEFSAAGAFVQKFGSEGSGNGQFKGPLNMAFSGGKVYVTDSGNNRVQKFSTGGAYESKFGEAGTANGKFSAPYGIATDPGSGNLLVADSGNTRVQLFSASGTFLAKFGTSGTGPQQFTAPTGIALSQMGIYIVDANTNRVEEWAHASWLATLAEGSLPSEKITYSYEAVEGEEGTVIEPLEALAPPPAGVSCGTKPSELKKGCRALTFSYATSTTASGENRGQWGEYKGRLIKIVFHGYNPTAKAMEEVAVAQYEWDAQGRLRAEWDPRVEHSSDCGSTCSALKTAYGYDAEQHVTGLTPPGQASWAFLYGAIPGDSNKGRVLKVTQAPASASLWNGQPPSNEEAPKVTGTAQVGSPLSGSTGKWGNGAVSYGFEWLRCNSAGAECSQIEGATNPRYTPTIEDAGHTLIARVGASNGGGTTYASSSPSSAVKALVEYSLATGSEPAAIAVGADNNLWLANRATSKIAKVTLAGAVTEYALPGSSYPNAVVKGPDENIWFTDGQTSKVGKITTSGTRTEYALPIKSWPSAIAVGSDHNLWVAERESFKIAKVTTSGAITQYSLSLSEGVTEPDSITAGPDGNLWFTTQGKAEVGKITTGGTITEYPLSGGYGSAGRSITAGPDGALWFVRENSKVGRMTTSGTLTAEYALPAEYKPSTISTGPDGNLWITSDTSSKLVRVTPSAAISEYPTGGSLTRGAVAGPDGNLWVAEDSADKVGKLILEPAQVENYAPSPGYTLAYHVPLSGSTPGLPNLTKEAVEKWRQKDLPIEGMAVIPPDEPQGWPPTTYRRATINYLDEFGRTVNVATPAGGVSTAEYNEVNEVTRSLTADNRATALNEGTHSGEVSEKLDTKTQYNAAKNEIVKITGPQHAVKLSAGTEVQGRSVTRDFYDEGAPAGKFYGLLTKTTTGAEYEGKEADVRTTLKSYSGQEGLGWTLRQPTSSTTDPSGLDLVSKTLYDPSTGNVIETRSPGGNSETIYPPAYASTFGGEGSGSGQLKLPGGGTFDASGNLWVPDADNNRVEEFSSAGAFIKVVGWGVSDGKSELQVCTSSCRAGLGGSGNGQFKSPRAIAINTATGDFYVADTENNRVQELSSAGAFVASIGTSGSGTLKGPEGLALDSTGDLWVSDTAHNRVAEFGPANEYLREVSSAEGALKGPTGITVSEGTVFVVDAGNNRVVQLSPTGGFVGQFGSKGSGAGQLNEPGGIAANPSTGTIYVADLGNQRMQEFSPAGRYLTSWETWGPSHTLSNPVGLAISSSGKLYISDLFGSKVTTWTPPEAGAAHLSYASHFGSSGSGAGQLSVPIDVAFDGEGNRWVSDLANNRIDEFSPSGAFIKAVGWGVSDGKAEAEVCTSSCRAGLSGSGNGEFNAPGGIDVNQSNGRIFVADINNARVEVFSSAGSFILAFGTSGSGKLTRPGSLKIDSLGNVWVPDMSANKIFEFGSKGDFKHVYGTTGSGEVQFNKPIALAFAGENVYIADSGNHRVQEITSAGAFVRNVGIQGPGSGELYVPEGIAADAAGNLYVVDNAVAHVEEFNSSGAYMATFATKGSGSGEEQLNGPVGDAIDPAGNLYVVDTENNRVQKWSSVNQRVRYAKTVYYSVAANSEYPQCGERPEWANLACLTQPVAQPSDAPPNLPVTSFTYNLWQQVEIKTEQFGATTTRTTTEHYDAAQRPLTSEETATSGASLPQVTNEYSPSTGSLIKQSTPEKSITSTFDNRLLLTKYTDADGNESTYTYDEDNRPLEVNDGKGTELLVRDPYTGELTELLDSAAGKFTATYDPEGRLSTQSYPNGMTASYKSNAVGQEIKAEYVKTTHCSSNCTWFSETIVPSIYGHIKSATSTLSSKSFSYDSLDRPVTVQETPAGKGCTMRVYTYAEESERTSLTTREPGVEGKCAEAGGTTERHIYDEAGRLVDGGVTYDPFGNTTNLPAADAGGDEMTAAFFIDNQVKTQTQNGETLNFSYDPAGRTRETVSTGKTSDTTITHYTGPGETRTWMSEGGELWTRNIPGIDGAVDAVQSSAGAPVLELHDLQGDIVGTAGLSELETKLLSTYDSTEFGVPQPGTTPPKYAWLGAEGVTSEPAFASGASTDGGAAYVPQLARSLQTAPVVPPGAFPNGAVSEGTYKGEIAGWYVKVSAQESAATLAEWTAKQEALRREAEANALSEAIDPVSVLNYEETLEAIDFIKKTLLTTGYAIDNGQGVVKLLENSERLLIKALAWLEKCSRQIRFEHGGCFIHEEFTYTGGVFVLLYFWGIRCTEYTSWREDGESHYAVSCPKHGNWETTER